MNVNLHEKFRDVISQRISGYIHSIEFSNRYIGMLKIQMSVDSPEEFPYLSVKIENISFEHSMIVFHIELHEIEELKKYGC